MTTNKTQRQSFPKITAVEYSPLTDSFLIHYAGGVENATFGIGLLALATDEPIPAGTLLIRCGREMFDKMSAAMRKSQEVPRVVG